MKAKNPARMVPVAFAIAIGVGTLMLILPISSAEGRFTAPIDALFTAVSATCVTGLITVDTATHWSLFGKAVILVLIQIGGFGLMTLTTMVALLVGRQVSLSMVTSAQSESRTSLRDIRHLPQRIALAMIVAETVIAIVLTLRFRAAYDGAWATAIWHGVFHSISAFNNAGFALYSDNLMGFVTDAWIIFPVCAAVIAGGVGFPVYSELIRRGKLLRPHDWSVHVRLTVVGTLILLVFGFCAFAIVEWRNHATIGTLDPWGKIVGSVAGAVFPRTAGFNSIDMAAVRPETLLLHYALMLIGGGSASTAGGIKVGTFFLLAYVIWSEVTGQPEVRIGHRTVSTQTIRQALTVVLLAIALIALGTVVILSATHFPLDIVLFECVSAFATVGLSANLTPLMPPIGKVVLMILMFCGRVGPITVVAAMTVHRRQYRFHLPEERPLVG